MNLNKNNTNEYASKKNSQVFSDENCNINANNHKNQPQFPKMYESEWQPNSNYNTFNNVNKMISSQRVELNNIGLNKSINISFNNMPKPSLNELIGHQDSNSENELEDEIDDLYLSSTNDKSEFDDSSKYSKKNIREKESFEKFNLEKRDTPSGFISHSKITHKYLPHRLRNNTKYKKKLMMYLRKEVTVKSKNESCRQNNLLKESRISRGNLRNLDNKYLFEGENGKEKINVKSCFNKFKKTGRDTEYEDYMTGQKIKFYLYDDEEIGFNYDWQKQLKVTEMDDDIVTDEDQLEAAIRHIRKEVREASYILKANSNKVRNLVRFKHLDIPQPMINFNN